MRSQPIGLSAAILSQPKFTPRYTSYRCAGNGTLLAVRCHSRLMNTALAEVTMKRSTVSTSWLVAAVTIACLNAAHAADDPRSVEAVAAFRGLCVSLFSGGPSLADPAQFQFDKFSDVSAKRIKPELGGRALWSVRALASGAMMLVHYEPQGMCVVEVAEADAEAMAVAFEMLTSDVAAALKTTAVPQPAQTQAVGEATVTTSMWRLQAAKEDFMLAISSLPKPGYKVQHVMTASRVK